MIPCSREELSSLAATIHAARAVHGVFPPADVSVAQAAQAEAVYCVGMALAIIKEAEERLAEQ